MSDFLQMDLFFFISSVSVIVVTVLLIIILIKVSKILSDIRSVSKKAQTVVEAVSEDVQTIHNEIKKGAKDTKDYVVKLVKKVTRKKGKGGRT